MNYSDIFWNNESCNSTIPINHFFSVLCTKLHLYCLVFLVMYETKEFILEPRNVYLWEKLGFPTYCLTYMWAL
jgi:hypothetical protein